MALTSLIPWQYPCSPHGSVSPTLVFAASRYYLKLVILHVQYRDLNGLHLVEKKNTLRGCNENGVYI